MSGFLTGVVIVAVDPDDLHAVPRGRDALERWMEDYYGPLFVGTDRASRGLLRSLDAERGFSARAPRPEPRSNGPRNRWGGLCR